MDRASEMRTFWDDRARENAAFYVDTMMDYDSPDMSRFFEAGHSIVDAAFLSAPVKPAKRRTALEIGPGLGRISSALGEHFDRVVGVDISEEMVERARRLVDKPNVTFEVGNGTDLKGVVDDASMDFVTTFTVLQHMPSEDLIESYLCDAARVLAPGGVLAAQWNNLPHPTAWRARAVWWRLRDRIGGPLRMDDPRNARPFIGTRLPVERVTATLERSGLRISATRDLGTLFAWVWAVKPE